MADYTDGWKQPAKILRINKRKKVSQCVNTAHRSPVIRDNASPANLGGLKRKNPFGCPMGKKSANLDAELGLPKHPKEMREIPEKSVLDKLDVTDQPEPSSTNDNKILIDNVKLNAAEDLLSSAEKDIARSATKQQQQNTKVEPQLSQSFPCDWSLKNKVRFVSTASFAWCSPLKSAEEAWGIKHFVREKNVLDQDTEGHSLKEALHSCCMYWIHPNLPWLKLVPRIADDNKIGPASCMIKEEIILNALQSDWAVSFTSLYQQLRADLCPFFYVCTHNFTVLFRLSDDIRAVKRKCLGSHSACETARSPSDLTAVVSPTSRGFRESLASEGIEFSMPLNKRFVSKQQVLQETSMKDNIPPDGVANGDDGEVEDEEQEDDSASRWLTDLGLDKKKFKSLDPAKVKLERESFRQIDNRAESTVVITGYSVQALYNLLLNSRSCVANTGIQTGIPPTLLSPAPFQGATLQCLKAKQGTFRHTVGRETITMNSLDLTGPILPSALHDVCSLLQGTQTTYQATFSVQDVTAPLNAVPLMGGNNGEEGGDIEEKDLIHHQYLAKSALRELHAHNGGFKWTSY